LIPIALLAGFIGLRIACPKFLESLQLQFFDQFIKMKPRIYGEVPVAVVDIDDKSLEKIGQWPWPRTETAKLVSQLAKNGASVIAFDILFAEPDRTSPKNIANFLTPNMTGASSMNPSRNLPGSLPVSDILSKLPDHDSLLAGAMAETRVVTPFSLVFRENAGKPALKAAFAYSGDDPLQYLPEYRGAVCNLPEIERASSGSGSFNVLPDSDGILRRIPVLFRLKDTLYPSLVLETLRTAQGEANHIVKSSGASKEFSFGEHTGIVSVRTGTFVIPTDGDGKMWLYDTNRTKDRSIPAWQVLAGEVNPKRIEGKIIYIGTSAEGLKDTRATPLNAVTPGVEIHAQLTEQILLGEFLARPDWAPGAEILYALALGLFLIVLMQFTGAMSGAIVGILATAGVFHFSWWCFTTHRWLLDPVLPSLEVLVIYLASSFLNFLRTESEKKYIRGAFSRYMSPALVEELAKHPEKLKLGGETRTMTLLLADIRDFTALSEKFEAKELTLFLNRFLTPMSEIILDHQGTIDKYMGDSILAFWNAPLDDPGHVRHACETALEMRRALALWNREILPQFGSKKLAPVKIGVGINTGDCCVGNLGSEQRFDYSVLGDDVNLASRLEGLSKIYGLDILLGENTATRLGDFALLELDMIRVHGKTKPVRVYSLLGDSKLAKHHGFQKLEKLNEELLLAYRAGRWDNSDALVKECLHSEIHGHDLRSFYLFMQSRILELRKNPPPHGWDGVTVALSK
jgi:adenylate cyclase